MNRQRLGIPSLYLGPSHSSPSTHSPPLIPAPHSTPALSMNWYGNWILSFFCSKYLMPPLCPEYHSPHCFYQVELLLLHSPDQICLHLYYFLRQSSTVSPKSYGSICPRSLDCELLRTAAVSSLVPYIWQMLNRHLLPIRVNGIPSSEN